MAKKKMKKRTLEDRIESLEDKAKQDESLLDIMYEFRGILSAVVQDIDNELELRGFCVEDEL
jgi:hypothetical protein